MTLVPHPTEDLSRLVHMTREREAERRAEDEECTKRGEMKNWRGDEAKFVHN